MFVKIIEENDKITSVELAGRTPSPFSGTMGSHSTAWCVYLDAIKRTITGKTINDAIKGLKKVKLFYEYLEGLNRELNKPFYYDRKVKIISYKELLVEIENKLEPSIDDIENYILNLLSFINFLPGITNETVSRNTGKGEGIARSYITQVENIFVHDESEDIEGKVQKIQKIQVSYYYYSEEDISEGDVVDTEMQKGKEAEDEVGAEDDVVDTEMQKGKEAEDEVADTEMQQDKVKDEIIKKINILYDEKSIQLGDLKDTLRINHLFLIRLAYPKCFDLKEKKDNEYCDLVKEKKDNEYFFIDQNLNFIFKKSQSCLVNISLVENMVNTLSVQGRPLSPFSGSMGNHTTAWCAIIDYIRETLRAEALNDAIDKITELIEEVKCINNETFGVTCEGEILDNCDDPFGDVSLKIGKISWKHCNYLISALKDCELIAENTCNISRLEDLVIKYLTLYNLTPYTALEGTGKGRGEATARRVLIHAGEDEDEDTLIENFKKLLDYDEYEESVSKYVYESYFKIMKVAYPKSYEKAKLEKMENLDAWKIHCFFAPSEGSQGSWEDNDNSESDDEDDFHIPKRPKRK